MSKLYTNKKAGTSVLTGKITKISDDRKMAEVTYNEYNYQEKKSVAKTKNVLCPTPLDDSYKVGKTMTAVGYVTGPVNFQPVSVSNEENVFEMQDIAFLSGHIVKAALNEEKDKDGNPKLKADGSPKKPHFDVQLEVARQDGQIVHHFVKVYDSPKYQEAGQPTNIEKYQKRFADFVNAQDTPMYVTIATTPGQEYSFTKDDGTVYLGCSHLGINSLDIQYEFSKDKTKGDGAKGDDGKDDGGLGGGSVEREQTTTLPPAPNAKEVNGFDVEMEYEEEFEN